MKHSTTLSIIGASCLTVLSMACGPSQESYDALASENRDLESKLSAERARGEGYTKRLEEQETENALLIDKLKSMGANVESLQGDLTETQRALAELREREAQSQSRLATFQQLLSKFKGMIASGRLKVRVVRNRMVVELPEGVLFASGRADLKEEGQGTLAEVAKVLSEIDARDFQVAGHTDNIPVRRRFRSNWELSTARAVTVAKFLIENGVSAGRLSAAGYADTQPVSENDTAEGRAKNRRIEIALVPNLDELPDLSQLASE